MYKNILLIDDDEEDQEIFKTALSIISETVSCTSFSNAKEALNMLYGHELDPDVIFLDLNMPIMSGQEFLVEVKKSDSVKHIPVIIFSTTSNLATIQLTRELGAADFITKPHRFDALVDILKPIIN